MNRYAPPTASVGDPPHDGRPSVWFTKLLAIFFAFFCVFSLQSLLYQLSPWPPAVACLCGLASLGLWLERPWSRWVVHLISALLCCFFAWYVWVLMQTWPYESTARSVASLLAGLLLLMFGVTVSVYVARVFPRP